MVPSKMKSIKSFHSITILFITEFWKSIFKLHQNKLQSGKTQWDFFCEFIYPASRWDIIWKDFSQIKRVLNSYNEYGISVPQWKHVNQYSITQVLIIVTVNHGAWMMEMFYFGSLFWNKWKKNPRYGFPQEYIPYEFAHQSIAICNAHWF